MDRGYVKLWRKTLDSRIFKNEGLLKVWVWCLMRANHKTNWVSVVTGRGETEVKIEPGQFVFGRKTAAKELRMKEPTVQKRIVKLKNMQNIDIKSITHCSIITIINWDIYQPQQHNDVSPKVSPKYHPSITDKNVKNNKNNIFLSDSIEYRLSNYLWNWIKKNNPNAKEPNLQSWCKHIDLMIRIDKRDPEKIKTVIAWSQKDPFWFKNILSTENLRKQFEKLELRADNKTPTEQEEKPRAITMDDYNNGVLEK
uniref:Uncharacterized protein n=1 Tax=viral metagenome TaxID=1070528 RepID=A0A6H1ZX57_9ZZZZ